LRVSNAKYQKEEVICGWVGILILLLLLLQIDFLLKKIPNFPRRRQAPSTLHFSIFVSKAEKFRPKMIGLENGLFGVSIH